MLPKVGSIKQTKGAEELEIQKTQSSRTQKPRREDHGPIDQTLFKLISFPLFEKLSPLRRNNHSNPYSELWRKLHNQNKDRYD